MDAGTALRRIASVVGPEGLVDPSDAAGYLEDERRLYRGAAAAIVRPKSVDECARILALCNAAGIGVVPQGGNTGYCGGATPFDAGDGGRRQILLSTARLDRIREVDPVGFTLTAEAGVVLARAQAAAAEHGLLFPLSMGSEGSCRLGGNLSTNAGGLAVLRYGTARDLVLGLEVVLPSGEVLSELKGLRKDNTGFDLKALFLGAEGTLGLVTAAVLKLYPAPRSRRTAWLAVRSPAAACAVLARARRESGDEVVSAEYVSRRSLDLVLRHVEGARDPLEARHEHHLLLELASADGESVLAGKLERILEGGAAAGDIDDGAVAESGPQRDALWRLRERIPEAERRDGGSVKHDVSVRISLIPEFLARAEPALAALAPHRLSIYGHIGDGNLHFNLLPPPGRTVEAFRAESAERLSRCIHDLAAALGGSFSAEHGIGILKVHELERYKSRESLALMRAVKRALDPNGIMNPGKMLAE
ncbi:MAG TPA: FAD-binding oxidoreductase [Gammaproteobacteria bacterium]|nr:FAD-binding oxidoreductase [Gammaproteobacteria bacterium]